MKRHKPKNPPVVHRVPTMHRTPREVPDCNRPLMADRGASPGGLPPAGIKPGWRTDRARRMDWDLLSDQSSRYSRNED